MKVPRTHYLRTVDGVSVAYQVCGDGPRDLLLLQPSMSQLDLQWDHPIIARNLSRLASFTRLIMLDPRGVGLSQRSAQSRSLEQFLDDIGGVLTEVGSEQAALFGCTEAGTMCMLYAATFPDHVDALALYEAYPTLIQRDGYDLGWRDEELRDRLDLMLQLWGKGVISRGGIVLSDAERDFFGRLERASANPADLRTWADRSWSLDVRGVLPTIRVPTLVIQARDSHVVRPGVGRWLADAIDGARLVEVDGAEVNPLYVDPSPALDEVELFLTGARRHQDSDRALATVLFTDIVGSTGRAAALGDRGWAELLDRHDASVRRTVQAFRGRWVKATGDGLIATFDGPARAIHCGQQLVVDLKNLGFDIRVGVHTGEIEQREDDIAGLAVHIAARVVNLASPGCIAATRTVKDLVVGSDIAFVAMGEHRLRGVPDPWPIYQVVAAGT